MEQLKEAVYRGYYYATIMREGEILMKTEV